jgi:hypothetical protein
MAKISWTFTNASASIDFTSIVQNFSYTHGRASTLDSYNGGSASITVANDAGQVVGNFLKWGQEIEILVSGNILFKGWVGAVNFNDMPGSGGGSTATITLNDQMYFAGQQLANNQVIASETYQIQEINTFLNRSNIAQYNAHVACRASLGFSGSYATRINQIISSDRGKFFFTAGGYYTYVPLSEMKNMTTSSYTFGRTASANVIAYNSFDRDAAGSNQNFVNQAAVTPESLATQTSTSSVALITGVMGIDIATLNTTTAVGKNLATWVANSMDNSEELTFTVSCLDIAQTATTNLVSFLTVEKIVQMAYTPPGGVSTNVWVTAEQISVTGDYNQTAIDIVFSPLTYYNFFTLNSAVFGILDTSKLGF